MMNGEALVCSRQKGGKAVVFNGRLIRRGLMDGCELVDFELADSHLDSFLRVTVQSFGWMMDITIFYGEYKYQYSIGTSGVEGRSIAKGTISTIA